MDLPSGATLNPDGSVTLALEYPFDLRFRVAESDAAQVEHFERLVLRRLSGADVRKMVASQDPIRTALAISLGVSLKKLILIENVLDARDDRGAKGVLAELLGGMNPGLPSQAEEIAGGVRLTFFHAIPDEHGEPRSEIILKNITAAQRQQIARSPSILDWGVALAAAISPKAARCLIDAADGVDAMAMNMVVLFLCGINRAAAG